MDPRRRGSHCSRNILSLLELGSSGQERLRGKLWPLSFGGSGWHPACGFLEPGLTVDWDRYTQLLRKLKSDIRDKRPDIDIKDITIRHDNSSIHTSLGHGWETCETGVDGSHPPYSTDLASSDFHLFGLLTDFLRGQYFTNDSEMKTTVSLSSKNVDKELYRAGFQQCARRWEKCVLVNGNWEERWFLTAKEAGRGCVSTNANSHFVEQIPVNMWY